MSNKFWIRGDSTLRHITSYTWTRNLRIT